MRVQHWQQDQFITPNRYYHHSAGDFWSLDALLPARDNQSLKRMPSWTGHIDYVSNFDYPFGAYYEVLNNKFYFIGTDTANSDIGQMVIEHADLSTSGVHQLSSTPSEIGGRHKLNVAAALNSFWLVGSDRDVYRTATTPGGYTAAAYTGGDAHALLTVRDTIFMLTQTDDLYRYDNDASAFASYLDNPVINVEYMMHYRENIVLFCRQPDGALYVYLVDDRPPADLRQLAYIETATGRYVPDDVAASWATPWAIQEDKLFFSPGVYWSSSSDCEVIPIWLFDGNSVELVDKVDAPVVPTAWGLVQWRGRLILYFLSASAQYIYLYHGGRFVQVLDGALTCPDDADLYPMAGELWLPTTESATDGWTRLEDYEDGVFISSWIDMGRPTVQKHLLNLSAVVSDAVADFYTKIEYRTESGSWTQAANTANARHIVATDLGVDFYLLQIRVTLDDNTGNDEEIELESIAATYSYGR